MQSAFDYLSEEECREAIRDIAGICLCEIYSKDYWNRVFKYLHPLILEQSHHLSSSIH